MNEFEDGGAFAFLMNMDTPHRLGERLDEDEDTTQLKWLKSADGVYSLCDDSQIVDIMEPGMYEVFQDSRGATHAQSVEPETDELYFLPNNHINEIIAEVASFWEKAEVFKKYKLKHKRGLMLYGHPGTGKSSIKNLLCSALIENKGLVFTIGNSQELFWFIEFAKNHLRKVEPDRPIITIIEDIDKYMDGAGLESSLLNFLDGENSINHNVVIATTNRFDDLNDLLLRPSRFDYAIEVEKPDAAVRKSYLINKGLDDEKAEEWAKDTNGFSLAELKELFISVILLELDYSTSKRKINDQADTIENTTFKKPKGKSKSLGFGMGKKD